MLQRSRKAIKAQRRKQEVHPRQAERVDGSSRPR